MGFKNDVAISSPKLEEAVESQFLGMRWVYDNFLDFDCGSCLKFMLDLLHFLKFIS